MLRVKKKLSLKVNKTDHKVKVHWDDSYRVEPISMSWRGKSCRDIREKYLPEVRKALQRRQLAIKMLRKNIRKIHELLHIEVKKLIDDADIRREEKFKRFKETWLKKQFKKAYVAAYKNIIRREKARLFNKVVPKDNRLLLWTCLMKFDWDFYERRRISVLMIIQTYEVFTIKDARKRDISSSYLQRLVDLELLQKNKAKALNSYSVTYKGEALINEKLEEIKKHISRVNL